MIDDITRLEDVTFDGHSYTYGYSLQLDFNSLSQNDIDAMKKEVNKTLIASSCKNDSILMMLKFLDKIDYNYFDKEKRKLFNIRVSSSSCR